MSDQIKTPAQQAAERASKATIISIQKGPAAAPSDQKGPDSVSPGWDRMREDWPLVYALMAGTKGMRAEGEKFLPKETGEEANEYKARLARTILFNGYKRTVKTLSGKPFSKDVILTDEADEQLKELVDDIDLNGSTLTQFTKQCFEEGMVSGLTHILIDFPVAPQDDDGVPITLTLQEERELQFRPYFVEIKPYNLFGWRFVRQGGRWILTQIRFFESYLDEDGPFGETEAQQIKVLERNAWWIYRKAEETGEWVEHARGVNTLGEIPLVTYHANPVGFMEATPPLMDLAYLNLGHWQSSADQANVLHVARVPILFGKGWQADQGQKFVVSIGRMITQPSHEADLQYVEHTGKAIESGEKELQRLEENMATMGLEMLVRKQGHPTATGRLTDAITEDASLFSMIGTMEDTLYQAFVFAAKWLNLANPEIAAGAAKFTHLDFGITIDAAKDAELLLKARIARELDQETFLSEMKRRGFLDDEIVIAELIARLAQERQQALEELERTAGDLAPGDDEQDDTDPGEGDPGDGGAAPAGGAAGE